MDCLNYLGLRSTKVLVPVKSVDSKVVCGKAFENVEAEVSVKDTVARFSHLYTRFALSGSSSVSLLLSVVCLCRDIMSIYKEPPPGMFVVPDPQDMTKVKHLALPDKAL